MSQYPGQYCSCRWPSPSSSSQANISLYQNGYQILGIGFKCWADIIEPRPRPLPPPTSAIHYLKNVTLNLVNHFPISYKPIRDCSSSGSTCGCSSVWRVGHVTAAGGEARAVTLFPRLSPSVAPSWQLTHWSKIEPFHHETFCKPLHF